MPLRLLLPLCLLLLPSAARAHAADILYVEARRTPEGGVHERVTLSAATLLLLAPVDADGDGALTQGELEAGAAALSAGVWAELPLASPTGPCTRRGTRARVRPGFVELEADFHCGPGALVQHFALLALLPPGYKVVLGRWGEGEVGHGFAQGPVRTLTVLGGEAPAQRGLGGWVALGVWHILTGLDHLAFLLALLLVAGTLRQVLGLVTAFTAAHSLTLGATALGWMVLGAEAQRWVEAAIAASIVWVAGQNLLAGRPRHRAPLTFLFGLVHGFGFAGVLTSYGLGQGAAWGLLGFNLGVELGQMAVVGVVYPLLRLLARQRGWTPWGGRALSLGLLVAGAGWLVQRVAG